MYFFDLESPVSVTICEGNKKVIPCLNGGTIKVLEASYGRHDGHTCPNPFINTTNCHAGNSLAIVRSKCDDKPSCELDSKNSVFGDPCFGTYKYLEVKFQCVCPKSVTVCEGTKHLISCENERRISVLEASFGRHDRQTCPHPFINTTNCHAVNSLAIVKSKCDDKPSCELDSNRSVFGDPCSGTCKYLQVKYKCIFPLPNMPTSVTICEGKQATLSCQDGKKVSVLEASYGRHDRQTCPNPFIFTTNCHAGNSLAIVKGKCDNRPSCQLRSSSSVFGVDPCEGTYKYLQVKYQCIQ